MLTQRTHNTFTHIFQDTIQTDIKVESSQQLDSGDHDEDGSIDSRPSSSQASGKTVLTAIAQVHDNKALDLSSEEEALVHDDGQR